MGYGMRHVEFDHGKHWECLDKNKPIEEFVYQITNSEKTDYFAGKQGEEKDAEGNILPGEQVLSIVPRQRRGLGGMAICSNDHDDEQGHYWSMLTAYPFCGSGTKHSVVIDDINEDDNGVEALLRVSMDDGPSLSFFDTFYFKNKFNYKLGKRYDFILSGLAYQLDYAKPESIEMPDSEGTRGLRDVLNRLELPGSKEDRRLGKIMQGLSERLGSHEPVRIFMEGMAGIIPQDKEADYSIVGPVVNSIEFEMMGSDFYRINMVIARGIGDSSDIVLPIYVNRELFQDDKIPEEGSNLSGYIWLQGFLAGSREDKLIADNN